MCDQVDINRATGIAYRCVQQFIEDGPLGSTKNSVIIDGYVHTINVSIYDGDGNPKLYNVFVFMPDFDPDWEEKHADFEPRLLCQISVDMYEKWKSRKRSSNLPLGG